MSLELKVPSMACGACAETITKAVTQLDPAAKVEADPKTKWVKIDTQQPEEKVKAVITAAGYPIG